MAFLRRAKDPFREIQGCLQKRDYKGALVWFKPLLKKESRNTQIRLRYADTLVLAGSKNEAIRQYSKVADELAEAGFMIRAIAINKKIVQLEPSRSDVHEKLAAMNEERSKHVSLRTSLPLRMSPPSPPVAKPKVDKKGSPPVEEPSSPAETEPTLSLEESMAMEFGETAQPPARREPPAVEEEGVVEIDLGGVDLEAPLQGEGLAFEPADEKTEDEEETIPTIDLVEEPEEEPSLEIELEQDGEPAAEVEAPSFEVTQELAGFSEEPVSLELEEEEVAFELRSEAEEMGLGPEAEGETEEEEGIEEFPVEIETEPDMAADGKNPLVGLLGEDIESLIDSIIDDVGSSVSIPATPPPRQASRIPLFSDLTAEEFVDVAIMLVRRSVKAGTVIVKEGDPGDSMFIVSTGEVEATREEDGRQVRLATLVDGDFFGEMAVLSREPRTATVTTVKSTELLELSRSDLQEICSRHPEVEAKLRLAYDERRLASG